MLAGGTDVIPFMVGEPDFDTPEYIKEAAIEAIREGFTKYTAGEGLPELREAISGSFLKKDRLRISPERIVVTAGGKYALALSFQVLCSEGDEVLVPSPYYVSFVDLVKLAGGKPVIVTTPQNEDFRVTPEILEPFVTSRTKALILNSPSNPAGTVYRGEELEEIARFASRTGIKVVSDEVYDTIVFDGLEHVSIASLGGWIMDNTVIIRSFSKTYSMPGWRVGYAAGNPEIISAMANIQSQSMAHPDNIAQKAAVRALEGPQEEARRMCEEFERRRNLVIGIAGSFEGVSFRKPEGAFYLFLNIGSVYGKEYGGKLVRGSVDFAEILLDEQKVAVAPGAQFGADEYIRISYATSEANIEKGMKRIGEMIKRMREAA